MKTRIIAAKRQIPQKLSEAQSNATAGGDSEVVVREKKFKKLTAHKIEMRLKDSEKKFSDDVGECKAE